MADPEVVAMFNSLVAPYDRTDAAAHQFWVGTRVSGYGMLAHTYAHRLAYEIFHGPDSIPPGHVVRHRCNTRSCVRVEHLETGTQAENMNDMVEAGRTSVLGPLTDTDVITIRWMYHGGRFSQSQIASIFWGDGTGQSRVSKIVTGAHYAHLPGPITDRGQGVRPPLRED